MSGPHLQIAALAIAVASCGPPPEVHAPGASGRKGVVEAPPNAIGRPVSGQTLYVPAYSSVYTADRGYPLNLAITLSVRNADAANPIHLTRARYYDQDGRLVRELVPRPLRVGPMAAAEFFVSERDTRGGVSASFLVEWSSSQRVSAPVVEAVMIGTVSGQGISFVNPARVLADLSRPAPPAIQEPGEASQ